MPPAQKPKLIIVPPAISMMHRQGDSAWKLNPSVADLKRASQGLVPLWFSPFLLRLSLVLIAPPRITWVSHQSSSAIRQGDAVTDTAVQHPIIDSRGGKDHGIGLVRHRQSPRL